MRRAVSWIPLEAEAEKEIFLRIPWITREEKGRKKQKRAEGEGRPTGGGRSRGYLQ